MIEEDEYTQEELDEDLKELEAFYAQAPAVIIGDGKRKETDLAEWVDPDELRYNAKYGLDKNSEPLAVDKVLAQREGSGYDMTLDEGFDLLDADGDDIGSGLSQFNEPSGFNQW